MLCKIIQIDELVYLETKDAWPFIYMLQPDTSPYMGLFLLLLMKKERKIYL